MDLFINFNIQNIFFQFAKQTQIMNSVAESYVETFDLVCQHISDEKEKNVMLQKLKAIALDHAKMEQEFDIKHKALRHVDKKLEQVSDLDIDKVKQDDGILNR